jgi:hypothetical protein
MRVRSGLPAAARDAAENARPNVLVELLDPGNVALFRRRRGEVIVSPVILSHMLAQVALRRELRAVFDELFGPGGAGDHIPPPADYGLSSAKSRSGRSRTQRPRMVRWRSACDPTTATAPAAPHSIPPVIARSR